MILTQKYSFINNDMNHKIDFVTEYDMNEIEFWPNSGRKSRRYSGINRGVKDRLTVKSASTPSYDNFKMTRENWVGDDVMHLVPPSSHEKEK